MFNVHIRFVVHACHGHRYRPSSVPPSETEKKGGGDEGGDRLHKQSDLGQ